MKKINYELVYRKLNVPVTPLPFNYSPDEYGKALLSSATNNTGVSYASSTDYSRVSNEALIKSIEERPF